ncbi:MAG: HAD hydrolase-like protein [Eubacterium sp.]|jgi:Predicted phosphatases|nr:HAD hydrolase-like protein [Eubacterium sp.]
MKTILFDLDGTLIDSEEGVTKSVQYSLRKMGIEENDLEKLRVFIGPPLLDSYMRYYGMSEEQAKDGIRFYRERFEETGYQECLAYPYVKEILMHLKEHGYRIGLASSKPEEFCVSILEMLEISDYFDVVAGASMDGKIGEKVQVLNEALKRFSIQPEDAVLIGDTRFDAAGAAMIHMPCIGVSYGFGTAEELIENGCTAVFDTLEEVERYLLRG